MNCSDIRKKIEHLYLLDDDKDVMPHIQHCELCRSYYKDVVLRKELSDMPTPEPHDGFAEQAIRRAVERSRMKRLRAIVSLSSAAILVLFIGTAVILEKHANHSGVATRDGMAQNMTKERTVRVMIKALESRQDAMLAIDLSDNIRLKKYPDRHQLTWQTELKKGNNLLELPIVFQDDVDGYVHIRYRYDGKAQELSFRVGTDKIDKISSITRT